jgi:plasmid maintenance system antidote protein VapI
MAIRLARLLGISEEVWLNLQDSYDLYGARRKNRVIVKAIKPYKAAA